MEGQVMGRHYAEEFKREAVALVAAGHAVKDVAGELAMPQPTLWGWVYAARHRSGGTLAVATTEPVDAAIYQAALKRIAELEQENAFLGKASAFFARKAQP
jgi:transposase